MCPETVIAKQGIPTDWLGRNDIIKASEWEGESPYPDGCEYKDGFKYQLTKQHVFYLSIQPGQCPNPEGYWQCGPFIRMWPDGRVVVYIGYAWDGCSGPTKDGAMNQTPGLRHDVKYQLMRNGMLPLDPFRGLVDETFQQECRSKGMLAPRAAVYFWGVDSFGASAASTRKEIYYAP